MGMRPGSVIVLLTGGVIGPFIGMVIGGLAGGRAGSRVSTLTEVSVTDVARIGMVLDIFIDISVRTVNGFASNIGVSADVDANVWVTVMCVWEFTTLLPSLESSSLFCWTAFRCWSITAILGWRALHVSMPSYHVCLSFVLPVAPQFPNQDPPRAQQLSLPEFLIFPHLRHEKLIVVVETNVCKGGITNTKELSLRTPLPATNKHPHALATLNLHLHVSTPSNQLCPNLLLPELPQFLYQAPPGAQQLARPDFLNMPQCGHVILAKATPGVVNAMPIGVLAISHRANPR